MADKKLSQEEMSELLSKITNNVDETSIAFLEDYKKGLIDFNTLIKGLSKVYKAESEVIKEKIRQEKEILLVQKARKDYIKKIAENELKQSQSPMQRISNWLNTVPQQGRDETAMRIRARSAQRGIEDIISGRFASGLGNLAQTFPRIANFMGGPYYLAIQTVIGGLLKFDSALAKASTTAASISGGLSSEYIGKGARAMEFNAALKNPLYDIGMQGQYNDLRSALQKGYGYGAYKNQQSDYITTMAFAQRGLGSFGIDANSANNLISNLRSIEGKDQQGVYASLQRLTERFRSMSVLSPEQALQQATSLYDQTKHLGTNFEWASRVVARFEKELKNGTLALSDFAAVNRSLRSGNMSQNAGLAAMISDYASRTGINLPISFTSSNAIGQGFAVSTRAMLSNNQFARAYQGQLQEQLDQMGMSSRNERAGALQLLLQSRGINISPEAARNAVRSDGSIDLMSGGIIGSQAFQKQEKEEKEAKAYQNLIEKYYKGTTSWHTQILNNLGKIVNNTAPKVARGFSGDVSSDPSIKEFVGFLANPGNWLPGVIETINKSQVQQAQIGYGMGGYVGPRPQNQTGN